MSSADSQHEMGKVLTDALFFPYHFHGTRVHICGEGCVLVVPVDVIANRQDITDE